MHRLPNLVRANLLLAAAAMGVAGSLGVSCAHAAGVLLPLPSAASAVVLSAQGCNGALQPALGAPANAVVPANAALTKSSAILGGKMSKLDLIAAQQASLAVPMADAASPTLTPVLPGKGVEPAANGINCAAFASAALATREFSPGLRQNAPGPDDFLASRRLPVAKTTFDQSWNRVKSGKLPSALVRPMAGLSAHSRLAAVNAWANGHIRYVEDRDLYGRADYWAPASNTIGAGAGDCEDIAIVKMQMLASLGVPRSDMFLTVARDRVRNRDHAFLIVKSEGQFWMLDNATNTLLDASQNHDYLPILTFGASQKWLHGF